MTAHAFIETLAIVLGSAALTTVVSHAVGLAAILGYLVAGLLVGPHLGLIADVDAEIVLSLSELGVIFLMFSIGLELNLRKLVRIAPQAGPAAAVEMGLVGSLVFAVSRLLGLTAMEATFAGAAMAISSTMIIARTFRDQGVRGPFTELVYGILIFEDLAAVLLITVLTPIASGVGASADELALTLQHLGLFVAGVLVVGLLVVPRAMRAVDRLASAEALLIASTGVCVTMAYLADAAGYSVALGAFLAGSLTAESGVVARIESAIEPLRDLFGAIFFVAIGMQIDPRLIGEHAATVLALTATVMLSKVAGVSLGSFLGQGRVRPAVRAGLSMAQVGEFSFILVGVGLREGAVGPSLLAVAVGVSALTALATPLLIRRSATAAATFQRRLPRPLQSFTTLYGSWLDRLRSADRSGSGFEAVRRHARRLLVDALAFLAVAVAGGLLRAPLVRLMADRLSLDPDWGGAAMSLATVVLLVPFAVGLVRVGRRVGAGLADLALPAADEGRVDFALAPRRAFSGVLQAGVIVAVALPLLAITQPFLPLAGPLGAIAAGVAAIALILWRRFTNLDGHVQAGTEVIVEALMRQAAAPEGAEVTEHLADAEALLPGLGSVVVVRLPEAAHAVGRTLGEVDLRALSGAAVVAVRRGDEAVRLPRADEHYASGDVVVLLGSEAAVDAARHVLFTGELPTAAPETDE
jgi:CPA2 family monovalent cation:H+ antiporter-2